MMPTTLQKSKLQNGISLMEVILSLGIIAVILVSATLYYSSASHKQNISHVVTELENVIVALQSYDPGNSNYSGLGTQGILNLYNLGLIANSSDLQLSYQSGTVISATLLNPWNNPILVNGTSTQAIITTTLPSAAVCSAVQSNFAGSSCDSNNVISYVVQ